VIITSEQSLPLAVTGDLFFCPNELSVPYICHSQTIAVPKAPFMFDNIVKFIEINLEIVKLDIKETIATSIVNLIKLLVGGFFVTLALIFASIALALFLGGWLASQALGFGAVALLYLAGFGIFRLFQNKLKNAFREMVQKQIPENTQLLNELSAPDQDERPIS